MDGLQITHRPNLRRPVMIAAFEGWNDAGDAATMAARHLAEKWGATPFATIDPEEFYDFTTSRPQVKLTNGFTRQITWPSNEFLSASIRGTGRDAVLLVGVEPQLKWRTFCSHVLEVARSCGVEFVVTLGALLADIPHTRAVRVTGTANDQELVTRLALTQSRYEGPTGIVGVLHDALSKASIQSASLWAAVPHYLPGTPSPKAALALVERAGRLLGTSVPALDLQIASAQYERQVNEVVENDDDMRGYVRQLEMGHDRDDDDDDVTAPSIASLESAASPGPLTDEHGNLPSGDALAAELERFLRGEDPKS